MKSFKSCWMAVIIVYFVLSSVYANDVDDINNLVKRKVSVIVDLLGHENIEKDERNNEIIAELNEIIDFKLTAYLSLGKHWKKIKKKQKKEFEKIFQQYINNYIVEKIALYNNQEIEVGEVKIIKKGRAELNIGFQSGGDKYGIVFKLRKNKKKQWLVYDLDIEGVSVITTFRSQFSGVIKQGSFDVLLEKLRNPAQKS